MFLYLNMPAPEYETPSRGRVTADSVQVSLSSRCRVLCRGWLPTVLGATALGDLAQTTTKYHSAIDPSIMNEFATVAFR